MRKELAMRTMFLACVAVTAATLTGCQSAPAKQGRFSNRIFEDLPTPKDAVYRDNDWESFSYQGDTWRSGRFHFTYRGSEERAVAFFTRTMTDPTYGWTLENEDRRSVGSSKLIFSKSGDRCTVDIDASARSGREDAQLQIYIRVNHRR